MNNLYSNHVFSTQWIAEKYGYPDTGTIYVTFKYGIYKSGIHKGEYHDHGTSFKISKKNLKLLFTKYN